MPLNVGIIFYNIPDGVLTGARGGCRNNNFPFVSVIIALLYFYTLTDQNAL